MAYVLDIAVILIVALCVWHGWRRGLIRTAVMLVGFVLAAFIAGRIAAPIAEWIYGAAVAPRVEQAVVEHVQNMGETELTIGLESLFGEGTVLSTYFESMGWDTAVNVRFADLSEAVVRDAVQPVITQVLQPVITYLIEMLVSFLVFVILLIVVFLLSRLMDAVFKLPLLKQLNQFGGLAAGFLQGVFWALVFSALLQLAVGCGWLGTAVTPETVDSTYILSLLANWNWIF